MKVITIDGPAGAGKSTVARAVAEKLGWRYLDTGALYRAVTLAALNSGVDLRDPEALGELARNALIEFDGAAVLLDGDDVTTRIRDDDVTEAVSEVAANAPVRAALLETQRRIAEDGRVVIEGRDIGTTVAPGALSKIYLTASIEERARRRALQDGRGTQDEMERLRSELAERDSADAGRTTSPLTVPDDAVVIDSTGMSFDEVVAAIVSVATQEAGR